MHLEPTTTPQDPSSTLAEIASAAAGVETGTSPPDPASEPVPRPLRILLADDSEDNRLLVRAYLKTTPHHLDTAEDGEIATRLFAGERYDLVLMDMQMPVMDGCAAARSIRDWESLHGRAPTPILALTANAGREDVDRSLGAGCNAHLTKPIKKSELLQAILDYAAVPASLSG